MPDRNCDVISLLWVELNPHCSVHGCEIDAAGTVHIWLWYSRNKKQQPLELSIGNPPGTVIRGLRKALQESARAARLEVHPGHVINDVTGNSTVGQVDGTDK
jgi:hypothetical protein